MKTFETKTWKLPRKIKKMLKTRKRLEMKYFGLKMTKREWKLNALMEYAKYKYGIRCSYSQPLCPTNDWTIEELRAALNLQARLERILNIGPMI